jgi:hypothetical protein
MKKFTQLTPKDFPIRIRLLGANGVKEYVMLHTKQGGVLLNKIAPPPVHETA